MRLNLGRGFRSLMANDIKVIENTRPPSIVTLIDDFLQKRLAASPLAGQEIHLEEGPRGEVIVFVGKTRYTGVDEVADPQISGADSRRHQGLGEDGLSLACTRVRKRASSIR